MGGAGAALLANRRRHAASAGEIRMAKLRDRSGKSYGYVSRRHPEISFIYWRWASVPEAQSQLGPLL
jgi:hypothetical protein